MIISFKVDGDTIKTSDKETFYTGNVNSYIFEFDFSEEWKGSAAFCVMTNGKKSITLYVAENKCSIPAEILSGKGNVKLGLYGTDGSKRISTNFVILKVKEGAYEIGADDMTAPVPDVWEQLVSKTVPKIGDNGNWFVWSITENKYVDTGVYSTFDVDEYYKKSETDELLGDKVDKVNGKGLSSNDYTDLDKEKVAVLSQYAEGRNNKVQTITADSNDDQYPSAKAVYNELIKKVDKENGKGLSTNDYTDEEKEKLAGLQDGQFYADNFNYFSEKDADLLEEVTTVNTRVADLKEETTMITNNLYTAVYEKVDKEDGKGLSSNDFTDEYKNKLAGLEDGDTYAVLIRGMNEKVTLLNEAFDITSTKITALSGTAVSIDLINNREVRCGVLTSLTVTVPESLTDLFTSSVVFDSGDTATEFTTDGDAYYQGADCKYGSFIPTANNHYNMIYSYDGSILNCYVAAISTATESAETTIADDTDFTDEPVYDDMLFTADPAEDESGAEATESGAETEKSVSDEVVS